MDTQLRLGRIDYINADPFFVGGAPPPAGIVVHPARPTALNQGLLRGDLDASWISSIELLRHPELLVRVNPYCIAAPGPVRSVILASPVPFGELDGRPIRVSRHSATSVALLRILLAERDLDVELVPYDHDEPVPPSESVLLIGDEALTWTTAATHPHVLDLAEEWQRTTGNPMVFAVLAARRDRLGDPGVRAGIDAAVGWMGRNLEAFRRDLPAHADGTRRAGLDRAGYLRYFEGFQFDWTPATEAGLRSFAERGARLGIVPRGAVPEELSPGTEPPSGGSREPAHR